MNLQKPKPIHVLIVSGMAWSFSFFCHSLCSLMVLGAPPLTISALVIHPVAIVIYIYLYRKSNGDKK